LTLRFISIFLLIRILFLLCLLISSPPPSPSSFFFGSSSCFLCLSFFVHPLRSPPPILPLCINSTNSNYPSCPRPVYLLRPRSCRPLTLQISLWLCTSSCQTTS
jgi:hypothetical protein